MFVNIHISTANNSFTLVRDAPNRIIQGTKLKSVNCDTNSLTNTIYYLSIDGFSMDENTSNINTKNLIPIYVGSHLYDLYISLSNGTLLKTYDYKIYDANGNETTDNVNIDLFFIIN